jgi:RNA polymerase sigma factor (sigma-70 family)
VDDQLVTRPQAPAAPPADMAALVRAVDELIPQLTPVLWHVARAAGLGPEDAKDVVQTVWMNLFSHLDTIRAPGTLTAWLITATRREAWRIAAAGRRTLPADDEWLRGIADPGESLEERAVLSEEQHALWAALRTLSPVCQELLRIVAFVPRPDYNVVAERLGMAKGSVGPTRGRCLDKLRRALSAGST